MNDFSFRHIGDILRERHLVSEKDLTQAKRLQDEVGGLVGQALLRLGALSEDDLLQAQSDQLALPIMGFDEISLQPEDYNRALQTLDLQPHWLKSRRSALWQFEDNDTIHFIAQNIMDNELREKIEMRCDAQSLLLKDYVTSNHTLETALSQIMDEREAGLISGLSGACH